MKNPIFVFSRFACLLFTAVLSITTASAQSSSKTSPIAAPAPAPLLPFEHAPLPPAPAPAPYLPPPPAPAPLRPPAPPTADDVLAAEICRPLMAKTQARVEQARMTLETLMLKRTKLLLSFVYPGFLDAVDVFNGERDSLLVLLTSPTVALARDYNASYLRIQNSGIDGGLKQLANSELYRKFSEPLASAIERDLSPHSKPWRNGDRLIIDGPRGSWSIRVAPAGDEPALMISYQVVQYNYDQAKVTTRDYADMATWKAEFKYNPFTFKKSGLPKSSRPTDIEAAFTDRSDGQNNMYTFFNDRALEAAVSDTRRHQQDPAYRECSRLGF